MPCQTLHPKDSRGLSLVHPVPYFLEIICIHKAQVLSRNLQCYFPWRALLMKSKYLIPIPPYSRGKQTWFQAIECSFLLSETPDQRMLLNNLSILTATPAGIWTSEIYSHTGSLERTLFVRVNLPTLFKSLFFQLISLSWIFWRIGPQIGFIPALTPRGSPT